MTGCIINHITFGVGTVTSQDDKYIKVFFDCEGIGEKTFVYPDSFSRYIKYDDKAMQSRITEKLRIIKEKNDEEEARIAKEQSEAAAAENERIKALAPKKKTPAAKKKTPVAKKKTPVKVWVEADETIDELLSDD